MVALQSVSSTSDGLWGVSVGDSPLLRYPPEPRNSLGTWLSSAASTAGSVGASALGVGTGLAGMGDISNLLAMQIQIQQVMQTVSMASNVARSQHETEMAPIRNMRVG